MGARLALAGAIAFALGVVLALLPLAGLGPATSAAPSSTPAVIHTLPTELGGQGGARDYEILIQRILRYAAAAEAAKAALAAGGGVVPAMYVTAVSATVSGAGHAAPSPSYSTTNVQVEGIDEQDAVKTNGRLIAVARASEVVLLDPSSKAVVGRIAVDEPLRPVKGLFLVNDTLVVIAGRGATVLVLPPVTRYSPGVTTVLLYDVSNASSPKPLGRFNVTGDFVGSRLIGNSLFIVSAAPAYVLLGGAIQAEIPLVSGVPVPLNRVFETGDYAYYVNIVKCDLEEMKPEAASLIAGRPSWIYMSRDVLYVAWERPVYTSEALIKLAQALSGAGYIDKARAGEVEALIASGKIQEAADALRRALGALPAERLLELASDERARANLTKETAFAGIELRSLRLIGEFKVPGRVLDQFSIEEARTSAGRLLVVATTVEKVVFFPWNPAVVPFVVPAVLTAGVSNASGATSTVHVHTQTTASAGNFEGVAQHILFAMREELEYSAVYIINQSDLSVVGKLEGLAPGERIHAARLIGSTLYLVTFKSVDPLFAIDISDPANPRALGFLEIPGFSEYLHPITDKLLLGVGVGPSALTLKVSLFDVSNPLKMAEVSKVFLTASVYISSPVLSDHHAFTIDPRYSLVVIPVYYDKASGFAIISYDVGSRSLSLMKIADVQGAFRSIYIGDELYLIGDGAVAVCRLPSLDVIAQIRY